MGNKPAFLVKSDFNTGWEGELTKLLPEYDIRTWPEIGDPDDIKYALVWHPPQGMLASLPNLDVIFSVGAGIDHLGADPDLPRHLPTIRMVDPALTQGMVEYVVWGVLCFQKRLFDVAAHQKQSAWLADEVLAPVSWTKTIGMMGYGVLGEASGNALKALGFNLAAWTRSPREIDGVKSFHGDQLNAFLGVSDVVVNLLPNSAQTANILNKSRFAQFKKGAGFINAGRGATVVENDLIDALNSGHLDGAVLDVFHEEPLPKESPIWQHPRILLTPHVASVTFPESSARSVVKGVRDHEAGRPLQHVVDWEQGY